MSNTATAPKPTDSLAAEIEALESECAELDERIDALTEKRDAARAQEDEAEDAFFDGEGTTAPVTEAKEERKLYERKLNDAKQRQSRLTSKLSRLRTEHAHAERLDELAALARTAEQARQRHDAAFTKAVDAVNDALDTMNTALANWHEASAAFRKKAYRLEGSILEDRRSDYSAARALLASVRERGVDLAAVMSERAGVQYPRQVQVGTYWLPADADTNAVAKTVERLLRQHVKRTQGRAVTGGTRKPID